MTIRLADKAIKESSFRINFFIWDGSAYVTPNSAAWTLTDKSGNVINSREDVDLTPAEQMPIWLQGDDLSLVANYDSQARYLKVAGVMPNAEAGAIPFVAQYVFEVDDTIDAA